MPECVLAFGVFPFEKLDGGVFGNGAGEIPLVVVDAGGQHLAGEARRYGFGYLKRSYSGFKFLYAIVGKCDFNHD